MICEKWYKLILIFESLDFTSYWNTSLFVSPVHENPSIRLALKILWWFNRIVCKILCHKDYATSQGSPHKEAFYSNSVSINKIFRNIGKVFSCWWILWKYYQPKYETSLLQTIDTICLYSECSSINDGCMSRSQNIKTSFNQEGLYSLSNSTVKPFFQSPLSSPPSWNWKNLGRRQNLM